jgi:hypothetical protein
MTTTADAKIRVTADVGDAKRKVRDLGDGVTNLNGTVKAGQERIEKLATAVTGTSSVLGGMGAKAGAAAGAISNLATAFLAGGPLLAGLALATTGAAALASAWQEAEENSKSAARAFDTVAASIQATSRSRIQSVKDDIETLSRQLATFGMGATESQIFLARGQQGIVQGSIQNLRQSLREAEARRGQSGSAANILENRIAAGLSMDVEGAKRLREQFELDKRIADNLRAKLEARERESALLAQQVELLEQLEEKQAAAKVGGGRGLGRGGRSGAAGDDAFVGPMIDPDELRRRQLAADFGGVELAMAFENMDAEAEARKKHDAEMLKSVFDREKERTRILEEETKKRELLERQQVDTVKALASEVTGFLASVSMQFFSQTLDVIEQLAAGQEVAFSRLAAAFIRQIGTQIFGIGVRSTAEGMALAATLLLPGGQVNGPAVAAHLAVGSTLMGVGGQMAVGGAVASGLLSRGGGASGGGALAGGSLAPRGGGGGPNYNDPGSGNVTINFNGGTQLGDPTERALTMRRDMRRASRNVYMPRTG